MLSLVTAAEHQYRHDSWTRDREIAVLASIRERRAPAPVAVAAPVERVAPRARRPWARPIGVQSSAECTTVCATA
ncbi:hypothetical protein [Microbacterium cremeum]|uniref:hypothetical protein n=1 Tax=Microbacterium cremeum TaxID=2782169 RepID=UPI0018887DF2|nr:hypothetical protein [Microbacterium cremeum]